MPWVHQRLPAPGSASRREGWGALGGTEEGKQQPLKGPWGRPGAMPKACDACQVTAALVFCKADAAYLCGNCDSKVHGANKLASRHERVWMCEVCEMAPAAITCKADAAALCPACDRDIHSANPLARRHERVPITPFIECPSMIKVAHIQPSVNAHLMPDASGLLQGGLFDGMAGLEENAEADEEGEGRQEGGEEGDDETTAAEAASWILPRPGSGLPQRPAASNASDPLPRNSPVLPNLSLGMATLGMFASPYQQLPHRSLSEPGVGPGLPHHHHHQLALAKGMGFAGKLEPVTSNPDLNFDIDPFLDVEKMAGASAALHAAGLQGAHHGHVLQGLGVKDSLVPEHSHTRASPSISNTSSYDTLLRKKFSLANETQVCAGLLLSPLPSSC